MKIIFNAMNCGLGNQGGTQTIIRSANTLVDLGHDVIIIDTGKNCHTWTPLKAKHLIIKDISKVPNADIIIATGYKTVKSTVELPKRCGKKYHYIRGFETWKMNEQEIINKVIKQPTTKIFNSICLQKKFSKLVSYKINSNIVYPGYDFDEIYSLNIRGKDDKIRVGGLYNTRHKSKRSDWIIKSAYILKGIYKNLELWMFGSEKVNDDRIDKYFRQPSIKDKNEFYNNIDIFLSASCNEGLHMPPAEAMITGCPVVGINSELNGLDYLLHEVNGLISEDNMLDFLNKIIVLIEDKSHRERLGINARRQILEIGDRKKNMKKMVEIFEKDLENDK